MALNWAADFPQSSKKVRRSRFAPAVPAPALAPAPDRSMVGENRSIVHVARKVRAYLHLDGHNATNMREDITDMIRSDHIPGRDRFILHRVLEVAFVPSGDAPDGFEVALADHDRDWRAFTGIRHRFIANRIARIEAFNASLRVG